MHQQKIKSIIKQLNLINGKIKENPMLFYGQEGKNLILLSKELHILGKNLIDSGNIETLKTINEILK